MRREKGDVVTCIIIFKDYGLLWLGFVLFVWPCLLLPSFLMHAVFHIDLIIIMLISQILDTLYTRKGYDVVHMTIKRKSCGWVSNPQYPQYIELLVL